MSYLDLDLELFGHWKLDGEERCRVRVIDSPAGSMRIEAAEEVVIPTELRRKLDRLARHLLRLEEMVEVGRALAAVLFPGEVGRLFSGSLLRLRGTEKLRLRLRLHTYDLASLPWEYAYVSRAGTPEGREGPEGFLALDRRISFVRHELLGEPTAILEQIEPGRIVRVGVLLSNPVDPRFDPIEVGAEAERIHRILASTERLEDRVEREGTRDAFARLIAQELHVLHYAGHGAFIGDTGAEPGSGEGQGYIVLVGPEGGAELLPAERFARSLKQRGVRLVVLSCCEGGARDPGSPWTGVAPALIREGIPAVVAMQFTIGDAAAIEFSESLYRSLVAGEPIDAAVSDARQAIANHGGEADSDWGAPVLYLRSTERTVLFPKEPEEPREVRPLRISARYVVNLGLLVLALVLVATWLYRHVLFPIVPRWAGVAPGLVAFVGVALGFVRPLLARLRSLAETRLELWLQSARSTGPLAVALGVGVAAFGLTSSYHILYDGEEGGEYGIAVLNGSDTVATTLLRAEDRSLGEFRLFRWPLHWPLQTYRFIVTAPPVYEGKRAGGFPFWNTVNLRVPTDFHHRAAPLLQVVPDPALLTNLSFPGVSDPAIRFDLVLAESDEADTLRDVRFQRLVLAPDAGLLVDGILRDGSDRAERLVDSLLANLPSGAREAWEAALMKERRWITPLLRPGEISLSLVNAEDGVALSETRFEVSERRPPQFDVFLLRTQR